MRGLRCQAVREGVVGETVGFPTLPYVINYKITHYC